MKGITNLNKKTQEGEKGTPKSKIKTTLPNIYCEDCKRNHWGPCKCVVCDNPGHDEEKCPLLKYMIDSEEEPSKKKTKKEERYKEKRKRGMAKAKVQPPYCQICRIWGDHSTIECPMQRDNDLPEKKDKKDKKEE